VFFILRLVISARALLSAHSSAVHQVRCGACVFMFGFPSEEVVLCRVSLCKSRKRKKEATRKEKKQRSKRKQRVRGQKQPAE
jgi:hypothetical protein